MRVINCRSKNTAAGPTVRWSISAYEVVLRNNTTGDIQVVGPNVVKDCNISTAGPVAGGRDQAGAFTASTFVFFYWIAKPDGTLDSIASATSPIAGGPTLPTGYTHWAFDSACLLDAGSLLLNGYMSGPWFTYQTAQAVLSNGNAAVETHLTTVIDAVVPNIAAAWRARFQARCIADGGTGNAVTTLHLGLATTVDWLVALVSIVTTGGVDVSSGAVSDTLVPTTGDGLYYSFANTAGNGTGRLDIGCTGFLLPNGS
jgi:hypothetical protein